MDKTDNRHLLVAELNKTLEHLQKYQEMFYDKNQHLCRHTERAIRRVLRNIKKVVEGNENV